MDKLYYPKLELKKAEAAIEKMETATEFEDFEIGWTDYLAAVEKLWVKAERECQSIKNQFQPWQGQYTNTRKKDPLLIYIKQARDADQHSVQELIDKVPENKEFIPDNLDLPPVYEIPRITLYKVEGDKMIEVKNPNPGVYRITARHVLAKAFINSGVVYTVPRFHKGKAIKNETSPTVLAKLALEFYRSFLIELEAKFFK